MRENSPNVQVMKTYTCNVLLPRINCSTMRAESVNGPNVVLMNIHDDVCCVCTEASKDIFFFFFTDKARFKGTVHPRINSTYFYSCFAVLCVHRDYFAVSCRV